MRNTINIENIANNIVKRVVPTEIYDWYSLQSLDEVEIRRVPHLRELGQISHVESENP